ncbi:EboA domain-containing protein [Flavobacteriaceae bacterium XHP0103]|uniref:EboA domain-containing protein n=1 Tax=Marixanthotalea marina TaxID=2844359 RepID=UPI002989B7E8|nr:EboA domain-containing protein [Marixanthotalea marina]MBU3823087.1 EboA domain-containing protein [Marixanthotalea marina]
MLFENVSKELKKLIDANYNNEVAEWLESKLVEIVKNKSVKDLYLTYSLINSKVSSDKDLTYPSDVSEIISYLKNHKANQLQLGRVYMLVKVLESDEAFFTPKISNIIQVADTAELETFLKYLVLLPNPDAYKNTAVDTLRTNITPIFDAISLNNPYPSIYFNKSQWNQMYLKAAFMQRDLSLIMDIDKKANKQLARIISDFAHERWAASRDVDPLFWRPVSQFIDNALLNDMKKLFESSNENERIAAALCCSASEDTEAKALLNNYPELKQKIDQQEISWETIN